MKKVNVKISNVDDGATVYHNGTQVLHVHYMHEDEHTFYAEEEDNVKVVIHNMSGGDWHANIAISVDGAIKYKSSPQGNSLPLQPEAFTKVITI